MTHKRLLAAILNADVVGYTRMMAADEAATVASLDACRAIFVQGIEAHGGHVIDMAGDSVLAIFDSAVEAVRAALHVQAEISAGNGDMRFRIGLNLGDILVKEDGSVYGDGVNVAARLQAIADPGGVCLSANMRDMAATALDVDLEDLGYQAVKNVSQPIRAYKVITGSQRPSARVAQSAGRAERPSVAVLPFENVGGNEDQDYLAEGIAEDLITELSRLRSLLVIARDSSFAFKSSGKPVRSIAGELGARFVVHGSIRRHGERARITAELIDAESNAQLWAERYDRELNDMFAIQDEIAAKVLSILPSRIEEADLARSRGKTPDNLAAYEYLLRAKYHHHLRSEENNVTGLEMVEKAITLDPDYAEAYAWKACLLGQAMTRGYRDTNDILKPMVRCLHTALSLDDDNFETHRILSAVTLIQRSYERALFHAAHALDLNPNDPRVMAQYGEVLTALGKAEDAIIILENALKVDPHQPDRRLTQLGIAQFVARHYEDAIETLSRVSDLGLQHHIYLAASHAELGRDGDARRHAQEVRRLSPDFNFREYVYQLAYREDADREHHREALIRAGLADED